MNDPDFPSGLSRRGFLLRSVSAGGGLALAGETWHSLAAVRGDSNPFAYSVGRHEKTDPTLIHYTEKRQIKVPWKEAHHIALSAEGNLWVGADRQVGEIDSDGKVQREIALDEPSHCLAMAEDGTIYVGLEDHLEVYDAKGKRTAAWEKIEGRSWFSGISLNQNTVFAANSGRRVIMKYDRSGKLLGRIGERDRERGVPGFVLPSPHLTAVWHDDGLLRVNNLGRHQVEFYTPEGGLELKWGRPSAAIEGFSGCCNPISIAVLPDGRVVTSEKGLPRVKVYSAHGDLESVVAGVESFPENARVGAGDGVSCTNRASLDLATDAAGRVYILDTVTAKVHVMERKPKGEA